MSVGWNAIKAFLITSIKRGCQTKSTWLLGVVHFKLHRLLDCKFLSRVPTVITRFITEPPEKVTIDQQVATVPIAKPLN